MAMASFPPIHNNNDFAKRFGASTNIGLPCCSGLFVSISVFEYMMTCGARLELKSVAVFGAHIQTEKGPPQHYVIFVGLE
jgi:hypothetical protein